MQYTHAPVYSVELHRIRTAVNNIDEEVLNESVVLKIYWDINVRNHSNHNLMEST